MATPAKDVSSSEVLFEVSDHVATITFNRPEQRNTISGPMLEMLTDCLLKANENPDVRAVILHRGLASLRAGGV